MIRSWYLAARERRRNRDRNERIAELVEVEGESRVAEAELVEAMADQLAEIRTLPEASRPRR